MLDTFEILTTTGVVLWSRSYAVVGANVINSLIQDVFVEERLGPVHGGEDRSTASKVAYRKDRYTLKWTTAKELGLIFVAVYQSLLHISWIDKLLDHIKTLFVKLYGDQLKNPATKSKFDGDFDRYFDQQIHELETAAGDPGSRRVPPVPPVADLEPPLPLPLHDGRGKLAPGSDRSNGHRPASGQAGERPNGAAEDESTTEVASHPSRPASASDHLVTAPRDRNAGRLSRRARKAVTQSAHASSGEESAGTKTTKTSQGPATAKKGRKWDAEGYMDDADEVQLDYSAPATQSAAGRDAGPGPGAAAAVPAESWGRTTRNGEFILNDLDDEVHSILSSAAARPTADDSAAPSGLLRSGVGTLTSLFRNVVGGKTLTRADLDGPLRAMEEHLLRKNVAREAAVSLCRGVEEHLIGVTTGNFQSVETTLRAAMDASLRKILTPTTSLDLLREIHAVAAPSPSSPHPARPYVISIVGVNGVGKSTNLAKICYFLLQNQHRVLIAACDTFRSGAVEQLRVHARNLAELGHRDGDRDRDGGAHVALFEKGYGRDAAQIARDAVAHAAAHAFSVVLIDTAGRRHNDGRLMASLEKFAALARPDKIVMVGEALVGADAVLQARHFHAAFGPGRGLDGFLISKCDTVGDMVGTLVSMVFATGVPVLFLGTGQHYTDLRSLNVAWAVRLLMA
ncbi:MAG: hypothetical protein M1826_003078 [Phylliscum demangeonii]|nr:MAG: hypothetical protein M1826_003078 [Phylliscum demangeonii]